MVAGILRAPLLSPAPAGEPEETTICGAPCSADDSLEEDPVGRKNATVNLSGSPSPPQQKMMDLHLLPAQPEQPEPEEAQPLHEGVSEDNVRPAGPHTRCHPSGLPYWRLPLSEQSKIQVDLLKIVSGGKFTRPPQNEQEHAEVRAIMRARLEARNPGWRTREVPFHMEKSDREFREKERKSKERQERIKRGERTEPVDEELQQRQRECLELARLAGYDVTGYVL